MRRPYILRELQGYDPVSLYSLLLYAQHENLAYRARTQFTGEMSVSILYGSLFIMLTGVSTYIEILLSFALQDSKTAVLLPLLQLKNSINYPEQQFVRAHLKPTVQ